MVDHHLQRDPGLAMREAERGAKVRDRSRAPRKACEAEALWEKSMAADKGWSRRFDEPIPLPGGGKPVTLKDAIAWLAKEVPKSEHSMKEVQAAAHCVTEAAENGGPMLFAPMGMMQAINPMGTKPPGDGYGPGFWKMLKNFTWRNIAIFVIALLILSYVMLLGVIITVDRLLYVNWDRELDPPTVQPVRL
jgi:hypothetical protein